MPNKEFWNTFPSAPLPKTVCSRINTIELEKVVEGLKDYLTNTEFARAKKSISYLKNGAPAFQKTDLGPCVVKNSRDAITHGVEVTDSIANWVKKGFVAGPFDSPPLKNFRSNSILAVPQPDKVRICINPLMPITTFLDRFC